jgi:hypothetical protein
MEVFAPVKSGWLGVPKKSRHHKRLRRAKVGHSAVLTASNTRSVLWVIVYVVCISGFEFITGVLPCVCQKDSCGT